MHVKEVKMNRRDFMLTGAAIAAPLSFSSCEVSQDSTTGESLSPDDALNQLIAGMNGLQTVAQNSQGGRSTR
jgi:outer membrane protein assembly factor BamE (lipoprotein component of BamABCDE complex)